MSTPSERLTVLKLVSIFAETPEEILADAVDLLEEIEVQAGETIIHQGDLGNSMYIIAEGQVSVHEGERKLNDLGKFEVFGEMAALDPYPRSASVTAVTDCRLYRLEQEAIYHLIDTHTGVTRGIIRILSQRLRARMRDMAEDYQYMQQFARVTSAAVAVEVGIYQPESLDEVGERQDELGQLARVFQRMMREVYSREQRLKREVAELRIEVDKAKQARQVAEITETDYFQKLRQRANQMRNSRSK